MSVRHFLWALVAFSPSIQGCHRPSEPGPGASQTKSPAPSASAAVAPAAGAVAPSASAAAAASGAQSLTLRERMEIAENTPPPRPPSDHAKIIAASQILIAYRGALRASPKVTRSKEEARELAIQVSRLARAGSDFSELAVKYSDDPSVQQNLGKLGKFSREQMEKPFSDAAFDLIVMEITALPVETALGFHVIRRTE